MISWCGHEHATNIPIPLSSYLPFPRCFYICKMFWNVVVVKSAFIDRPVKSVFSDFVRQYSRFTSNHAVNVVSLFLTLVRMPVFPRRVRRVGKVNLQSINCVTFGMAVIHNGMMPGFRSTDIPLVKIVSDFVVSECVAML